VLRILPEIWGFTCWCEALSFRDHAFSATRCIAYDVRYDTSKKEGFKEHAELSEVGTMPLRGLSALLFLGGIVYAMLPGS
jgi:hypothetical protein